MTYALLTTDLSAIESYPVTIRQARAAYPELRNVSISEPNPTLYPRLVEVAEVPPPALAFGEQLVELDPVNVAGTWTQQWSVVRVTLVEAKQQLAASAVSIYWAKMLAEPSPQALSAAGGFVQLIQARDSKFMPKLLDVKDRIVAATTIDEAKAIYDELVALA